MQLLQLQRQFRLICAGATVLDLGCSPGAWLQVPQFGLFLIFTEIHQFVIDLHKYSQKIVPFFGQHKAISTKAVQLKKGKHCANWIELAAAIFRMAK